jgi:hypothetical protein
VRDLFRSRLDHIIDIKEGAMQSWRDQPVQSYAGAAGERAPVDLGQVTVAHLYRFRLQSVLFLLLRSRSARHRHRGGTADEHGSAGQARSFAGGTWVMSTIGHLPLLD